MKSLETKPNSGGQGKIDEYVTRIQGGESKESILQGLPKSFAEGIEQGLAKATEKQGDDRVVEIPPQYEGFDADTLDFIWTIPEYVDTEKTERLRKRKADAVAFLREREQSKAQECQRADADQQRIQELREQLGVAHPDEEKESPPTLDEVPLSEEEKKKLTGWAASYELAKTAKQHGVDLSRLSREEYAEFAIRNSLAIDDSQLRAAPWQRTETSVEAIIQRLKGERAKIQPESDKVFAKFVYDMKQKAATEDRSIDENIRVRQGTKDKDSWLFFGINDGVGEKNDETYKAYVSVKDLNTLTPERYVGLMASLRDAGYNGDTKIFQDLTGQAVMLNDQIVMHGRTREDAELGLRIAEEFFGQELDQKSLGKDEVINGENQSYSQILSRKIKESIRFPATG